MRTDPTTAGPPAISARALTRRFDGTTAVDAVDLDVHPGELFVFLGPNGAGKTTTIRMLTCQLAPTSGEARIYDHPIDGDPLPIKRRIGYLPEEPILYDKLSGREFLRFVAEIRRLDPNTARDRAADLLERFDLAAAADQIVEGYSLGMRKKLALISTLIHEPDAVFWDEPTGGLDPRAARSLKDLMREHCNRGGVVFMTTHVLEIAERLADRVAIISRGGIVATGAPADLASAAGAVAKDLETVFLELTETADDDPDSHPASPAP